MIDCGLMTSRRSVTMDRNARSPSIGIRGHHRSEWPVTMRRNHRSRSIGMHGHLGSEYAYIKSVGGERPGKRRRYLRQVRRHETNASEPSMKCRELHTMSKTGSRQHPGISPHAAYCGADGIRHRGGGTCHQDRIRNLGSCRADAKGDAQEGHPASARVPMPRTVTESCV